MPTASFVVRLNNNNPTGTVSADTTCLSWGAWQRIMPGYYTIDTVEDVPQAVVDGAHIVGNGSTHFGSASTWHMLWYQIVRINNKLRIVVMTQSFSQAKLADIALAPSACEIVFKLVL